MYGKGKKKKTFTLTNPNLLSSASHSQRNMAAHVTLPLEYRWRDPTDAGKFKNKKKNLVTKINRYNPPSLNDGQVERKKKFKKIRMYKKNHFRIPRRSKSLEQSLFKQTKSPKIESTLFDYFKQKKTNGQIETYGPRSIASNNDRGETEKA